MSMGEPLLVPQVVSVESYLADEARAGERHEFIDGAVYAMVGGTDRHNDLVGGLYMQLRTQLKAPCRAYMLDMKLRIEKSNSTLFYYPDLLVSCSQRDKAAMLWKAEPTLLVEVLSPSTERIDRTEKLMAYTQIPSLQDYLLVAQDQTRIEVLSRQADWKARLYGRGDAIALGSLGVTLALDDLYADT